jgi:hypothetical protein
MDSMETLAKDFVALLQYLLPGFVAAWIFYSFTSFPKPSQFERVIQALIFTIFVQVFVYMIKEILFLIGNFWPFASWTKNVKLIWSITSAVILGLIFSYYANNDKFHKILRKCRITKESSYPSEWFGAFLKNITFVVLHLEDERRIYGWPIEWPSEPDKGHFELVQASWIVNNNEEKLNNNEEKLEEIPLKGVESIIILAKDVKWVEFMKKTWEKNNG